MPFNSGPDCQLRRNPLAASSCRTNPGAGFYLLDDIEARVVPEPSTLSLFGLGLLLGGALLARKKKLVNGVQA
jgi:hypothetical protein